MRISKLPLLNHDGVAMEILTFPFFYAYEISRTLQTCALILPLCLFMRNSAAFVLLRLLRSFVERFYLSKERGRVLGILTLATKCYEQSPSPNLKRALVENTLAENPEENRDNEKSQKCS